MVVHVLGFADSRHRGGRPRLRLLGALARDLFALSNALLLAVAVAALFLLARTERGLLDVAPEDGTTALAIVAAAFPAWAAYRLTRTAPPRPLVARTPWLALHPAALPAWLWLAAGLSLPGWALASAIAGAMALVVLGLALASLVILLVHPEDAPAHARVVRLLTARCA